MLKDFVLKNKYKTNLFIVETPYQLIISISIILFRFFDKEYKNLIFIHISNKKRFNPDVSDKYKNIIFEKIDEKKWVDTISGLRDLELENFYFFQEREIINKYLSYYFKKKGTKICLGPDGTKAYDNFNKSNEFFTMLKDTFIDYKFLISNLLFLPKIYLSKHYRYGSFRLIDEIWLPFVQLFDSNRNKSFGTLYQLPKLEINDLSKIEKILKIKISPDFNGENCIMYFNQPFWSDSLVKKDAELVNFLSSKFYGKKIYVKIHPSTGEQIINNYRKIPGIILILDNVPAEFYIAKCKNSILMTGWSTCLMYPLEGNNKSYYLYLIFKKLNDPILNQINLTPFPHVKLINDLDEII